MCVYGDQSNMTYVTRQYQALLINGNTHAVPRRTESMILISINGLNTCVLWYLCSQIEKQIVTLFTYRFV